MSTACLFVVLALVGQTEKLLFVEASVERKRYFRSSRSTVEDLKVSVTVTNPSNAATLRFPAPSVGLLRGTPFTVLFYRPAFRKWKLEPLFPWFKQGQELTEGDVDELVRIIGSGKLPGHAKGEHDISVEVSAAMQEVLPSYFKRTTDVDNADLAEIERRLRAGEGPLLVGRRVREMPGAEASEAAAAAVPPGESQTFEVDIGPYFDFYAGGTYGVACSILGAESNVARFEILPVMRTDLRPDEIMSRFTDLELAEPRYEVKFYLCHTPFAWDEVAYVRRYVPPHTARLRKATRGPGGLRLDGLMSQWPRCPWPQAPRFELKRVCRYKPGTTPSVLVSGTKIGFLIRDPLQPVHWLYILDFSTTPAAVERRKAGERGGPEPSLSVDQQGKFQVM